MAAVLSQDKTKINPEENEELDDQVEDNEIGASEVNKKKKKKKKKKKPAGM